MGTKMDASVAVGFAPQVDDTTYNAGLASVADASGGAGGAGTFSGHGGVGNDDDGLLVGDSQQGILQSGLSVSLQALLRDKALIGSSVSRGAADNLGVEVPTFTYAFPFVGNRDAATATPVAADALPVLGMAAILGSIGLIGADVSATRRYRFGTPVPMSALIYESGTRMEFLKCLTSQLAITFTPGSIPIAVATVVVGSVQFPADNTQTVVAMPTLSAPDQNDVSAPTIATIANGWGTTRGFTSMTLTISRNVIRVPDSNATDGVETEFGLDRTVTASGTLFRDSAGTGEAYDMSQLFETSLSDFDALSWQVGDTMVDASTNAEAIAINIPHPQLVSYTPQPIESRAGATVEMIARDDAAAGNEELDITFL